MPDKMRNEFFNIVNDRVVLNFWDFFKNFNKSGHIFNQNIISCDDYFWICFSIFLFCSWRSNFIRFCCWLLLCIKIILKRILFWSPHYFISVKHFVDVFLNMLLMLKVFFIRVWTFSGKNSYKVSSSLIFLSNFF